MKETLAVLNEKLKMFRNANRSYRKLRKHLNKQPVGYPISPGSGIRLLRDLFTVEEAKAALCLDYKHQSFDSVRTRAAETGFNDQRFSELLDSMEKKGTIFVKIVDKKHYYALHPIAVGIFEMQVERMSPNFFLGIHKYFYPWFGLEFFTSKLPQLRTIPVEKSLPVDQLNIATYDQIRKLIEDADGRLGVARCICKVGKDLLDAPCKLTERRDLCLVLNENAESWLRNGWAKPLTKDEAFDLLAKNEKDGLVLSVSNAKIPYFVCSCCRCCCGVLEALNMMPRPVDFMESNYYAVLDSEKCTGCGLCVRRCQMAAITSKESDTGETPPTIDLDRCIGCGLCVTTCKKGAIHMKKKYLPTIPPEDMDDLNEILMENKKGYSSKLVTMAKAVVGRKVGN